MIYSVNCDNCPYAARYIKKSTADERAGTHARKLRHRAVVTLTYALVMAGEVAGRTEITARGGDLGVVRRVVLSAVDSSSWVVSRVGYGPSRAPRWPGLLLRWCR